MTPLQLLTRPIEIDLSPEEDAILTRELSAAYRRDEAAATDREVLRTSEKIRLRLLEAGQGGENAGLPSGSADKA